MVNNVADLMPKYDKGAAAIYKLLPFHRVGIALAFLRGAEKCELARDIALMAVRVAEADRAQRVSI